MEKRVLIMAGSSQNIPLMEKGSNELIQSVFSAIANVDECIKDTKKSLRGGSSFLGFFSGKQQYEIIQENFEALKKAFEELQTKIDNVIDQGIFSSKIEELYKSIMGYKEKDQKIMGLEEMTNESNYLRDASKAKIKSECLAHIKTILDSFVKNAEGGYSIQTEKGIPMSRTSYGATRDGAG